MSTVERDTQVVASCSFCKKNNTEVKKLIAGPGVYICDECVTLCDEIVAAEATVEGAAQQRTDFVNRSADELLRVLPAMVSTAAEVEADVHRCVERIGAGGGTWEQIATSLGMTQDAARRRFDQTTN